MEAKIINETTLGITVANQNDLDVALWIDRNTGGNGVKVDIKLAESGAPAQEPAAPAAPQEPATPQSGAAGKKEPAKKTAAKKTPAKKATAEKEPAASQEPAAPAKETSQSGAALEEVPVTLQMVRDQLKKYCAVFGVEKGSGQLKNYNATKVSDLNAEGLAKFYKQMEKELADHAAK